MRVNIKVDGECSMENVHDENEVRCERCGSLAVEEGYDMQLCCECRKELSRRPIPKSIIISFIGIIGILVLSLIMSTKDIDLAKSGNKLEDTLNNKNYISAIKGYEALHNEYPGNDSYSIKLLELYYNADRIDDAFKLYQSLAGMRLEKSLADRANRVLDNIEKYYSYNKDSHDEVSKLVNEENSGEKILDFINNYVLTNGISSDYYASSIFIDSLICKENYEEALKYCNELISQNNEEFNYIYYQLGIVSVALGNEEKANEVINYLLSKNNESFYARIIESRLELKRKDYKKAFELAEEAYNLDPKNDRVCINLSIANHYNGDDEEAKVFLNELYDDSNVSLDEIEWLDNVIAGKIILD